MNEHEIHGPPALEIRCCCNPAKLYGTLRLNGAPQMGQRLRFARYPNADTFAVLENNRAAPALEVVVDLEVDVVTLGCFRPSAALMEDPVAYNRALAIQRPVPELALKYHGDDLTFEEKAAQLRGLPGFEPSPEVRALLPDVFS